MKEWLRKCRLTWFVTYLDRAEVIASAGIPVFQVLGDANEIVPVKENSYVLRERLKAAGGSYCEIIKPGALHHPHGLVDPMPVVEFIIGSCVFR